MASTEHVPSFAHLEFDTPLYRTAIAQFDQAVPHANVDPGVAPGIVATPYTSASGPPRVLK